MKNNQENLPILLYKQADGHIELKVKLHNETLWLSLNQLAMLFDRDKSVISKHLKNIFAEEELDHSSTVANFATVQTEGHRSVERVVEYYNLDAIISVGYRVNSKQGTRFRQWSSKVLREYLTHGFAFNKSQLQEKGIEELTKTVELLHNILKNHHLISDTGIEVTNIILSYAKTWNTLLEFDKERLKMPRNLHESTNELTYVEIKNAIASLKQELLNKQEATSLFGQDPANALERIFSSINQTFAGEDVYGSIEEKAAHLLYFVIKDHPFTDGNKRIASFLFVLFLHKNNTSLDINNGTLIALALLVADSHPSQKELIIKLIVHLMIN